MLQAVKGPLEGQRISIEKDYFRIGADPDNDLTITSDIYLSGQHAAIQAAGGKWILVDRGSRNGTFVDGRKVASGPGQHLHAGQSIQVGTSEFRVIIEGHMVNPRFPTAALIPVGPSLKSARGTPSVSNRDPEIEVAVLSEKGRREENQDWMSWSRVPWGELFIVADGMGGHKGGALAARMTVEGLEKHLRDQPADWPFVKGLPRGRPENQRRRLSQRSQRQSGNRQEWVPPSWSRWSLTGRAQVGHIGDSRAYLFRDGKLRLLTKDHTTVQRMLDAGMITPRRRGNTRRPTSSAAPSAADLMWKLRSGNRSNWNKGMLSCCARTD